MLKGLEKSIKKVIGRGVRSLLTEESNLSSLPPGRDIRRVLVIRPDNRLGNLLLITPFLNSLRRALKDAEISLLAGEIYSEVFAGNEDVETILHFQKKKMIRFPWKAAGFLRKMKRGRFDLAIDMSHPHSFSLTSAILTRLSGAPYRLGFERGDSRYYLNLRVPMPEGRQHESDIFLSLLEQIGLEASPGPLRYIVSAGESRWAGEELRRLDLSSDEPLIGIFTGGRGSKSIETEVFLETASIMVEKKLGKIVFFLGPLERGLRDSLEKAAGSGWIVVPHYPLRQFAAILASLCVLVTSDSGPMHLASAIGVPIVSIFREDMAWRYGPRSERDKVLLFTGEVDCTSVVSSVAQILERAGETHAGKST
jgi:ADP-heptose:LPS heptosyltransferase